MHYPPHVESNIDYNLDKVVSHQATKHKVEQSFTLGYPGFSRW